MRATAIVAIELPGEPADEELHFAAEFVGGAAEFTETDEIWGFESRPQTSSTWRLVNR